MAGARATKRSRDTLDARPPSALRWAVLAVAFLGIAGVVYAPAYPGGLISDDVTYLLNPWVTSMNARAVVEFFDPGSQATLSLNNYAPLRPIAHGLQWQIFYDASAIPATNRALHLSNVVAHAIAAFLFALLLAQVGVSFAASSAAALVFLLHPANVEAVAWICELWSSLGLALGLGALLNQRRRPLFALGLFALALLAKPQAVCVLPVALLRQWAWRREPASARPREGWMLAWLAVFAAITAAELVTFFDSASGARNPIDPDVLVQARTIVALAGRYLAMAVTGYGVGAFQQPPAAVSWLDPWWLFGLVATGAVAALALRAVRLQREEAAFWVWGPAAFLPVSQILPFLYPFADRYLYFMLPGLIGATLLVGRHSRVFAALSARVGFAAVSIVCLGFGLWSHQRAGLWISEDRVVSDSARRWPDGVPSHLLEARFAAQSGDADGAIRHLELCRARGWDYYGYLVENPAFDPIRSAPRFQQLIRDFAGDTIARASKTRRHTQIDLREIADAHIIRGELAEARARIEQAVALGGPIDFKLGTIPLSIHTPKRDEKP